jgi:hypothetical protein
MKLLFWRNKKQTERLEQIEREASLVHKKNISKIVSTRQNVDKLNVALKQNNIVFQLAHVIGHK